MLRDVLKDDPNQVYAGLLRVLLRLVFILYAEDRSLLSNDEVYQKFYSVIGLFERLRVDAGRHTDTMDHRFGAWAQLLTLFRLIYDGGRHGGLKLLPRKGYLFDPDRYPFLEGRPRDSKRQPGERTEPPRVSDGVVFRVLQNLLILDGERLSYRTLDVEQIGSVYETIMGFNLEVAKGRSIAIKPTKPHGAPTTINLEELLAVKPADRAKWLKENSDQAVTGQAATALKDALTPDDAVAALEKKVARAATPNIVPPEAMVLQPSDERRRSGSHYTPRSLTEPIVRTTLRPILDRLGPNPTPDQILDLKVCDPAMGSGAFLVEACRQLAETLVKAWHAHKSVPSIPPDEDELLHARRIIAVRCLYGVDKNPMAVDLAKMSLWLATLAKDHPFTFLDHALRAGDSLVGLTNKQIIGFHWKPEKQRDFARQDIEKRLERALKARRDIREADDYEAESSLSQKLALANEALEPLKRDGDLVIAAFFSAENEKARVNKLNELAETLAGWSKNPEVYSLHQSLQNALQSLTEGPHPLVPFHWEIEFPEVFDRQNPGFDAMVGNPPFMGGTKISTSNGNCYLDWVLNLHAETTGNADLVAHFFRRSFDLIRKEGTFGLISTNTIGQGETRAGGLRWICKGGGTIIAATRRWKWPGQAAVIVSVVHVIKAEIGGPFVLDTHPVSRITAYLFHSGGHDNPALLQASRGLSFKGSEVYGMGFTFDDNANDGVASSLDEMKTLIADDPRNAERILPYIGGEEVNDSPTHSHNRFVINFGSMDENASREWPSLFSIVERKVKPQRQSLADNASARTRKEKWWQWSRPTTELYDSIRNRKRVLVCSRHQPHWSVALLPNECAFSDALVVFALDSFAALSAIQSRPHETWTRFFGSSMKDDLRYTPTDCFETYPFSPMFDSDPALESAGRVYKEFRADLMIRNNEGLTKTYNRFHDPDERSHDILKLRELHAAMDRAVLDAYGWTDLQPTCEFLLDYEEDDDEEEAGGGRRRKKPWRYRWPDEFRDEVLARLLELNRQRAQEERLSGAAAEGKGKKPKKMAKKSKEAEQPGLF